MMMSDPFHHYPGGGGVERVKFGMAKLSAVKIWHEFLNTMAKFGTKFPDCGMKTAMYRECSNVKSSVFRVGSKNLVLF